MTQAPPAHLTFSRHWRSFMLYSSIPGGGQAIDMAKRSLRTFTTVISHTDRHIPHRPMSGTRTRSKGVENG